MVFCLGINFVYKSILACCEVRHTSNLIIEIMRERTPWHECVSWQMFKEETAFPFLSSKNEK